MQQTAKKLAKEKSLLAIEGQIASLSEVFRLQGANELIEAENRYLPVNSSTFSKHK